MGAAVREMQATTDLIVAAAAAAAGHGPVSQAVGLAKLPGMPPERLRSKHPAAGLLLLVSRERLTAAARQLEVAGRQLLTQPQHVVLKKMEKRLWLRLTVGWLVLLVALLGRLNVKLTLKPGL